MAFSHGTQSGYNKYGCRCDECRAATRRKVCESCGAACSGRVCHPCRTLARLVTCPMCGVQFRKRHETTEFCSLACLGARNSQQFGRGPRKGRTCAECGATFDASNTQQATCSHECANARRVRESAQRKPGPASRVYFPACKGCGRTFMARTAQKRWCSYRCRVNDINDRCTSLYALACDIKRPGEAHMWRTVLVGYLIERDGDRCPMCRKRLDPSLPSGPRGDRMGVSIDHIVPRSQGGSDDLANLRAVHWHENQRRGNRGGFEQLALVG